MMKIKQLLVVVVAIFAISMNIHARQAGIGEMNASRLISNASAHGLQPKALKAALNAYSWARGHGKLGRNKNILTVVDFTLPSYKKRMWILDLQHSKVLMSLYTTQGKNSGLVYAAHFSNQPRSRESSLGLYVTAGQYYGGHGKAMLIDGLQKGINDNARRRSVVIHSAAYASPAFVKTHHRAGRSYGCFAIAPSLNSKVLNYIKGGSALFAYAPQIERSSIVRNGPVSL